MYRASIYNAGERSGAKRSEANRRMLTEEDSDRKGGIFRRKGPRGGGATSKTLLRVLVWGWVKRV